MLYLDIILLHIKEFVASIGVMVIFIGALRALYQLCMLVLHDQYSSNYVRLQFGDCVILGLEFMVGGDIVGSLVKPDYYNLGLLSILVVIRTILSYYLNLELKALTPQQQEAMK